MLFASVLRYSFAFYWCLLDVDLYYARTMLYLSSFIRSLLVAFRSPRIFLTLRIHWSDVAHSFAPDKSKIELPRIIGRSIIQPSRHLGILVHLTYMLDYLQSFAGPSSLPPLPLTLKEQSLLVSLRSNPK